MATKKYDMSVVVGTYTDRNGNTKNQYESIGAVFEGEHGLYAVMKKTFNPAGIVNDKDSIIIGLYEPKPKESGKSDDLPF